MRKIASIILASLLFVLLIMAFYHLPSADYTTGDYYYQNPINGSHADENVPSHYIADAKNETGAVNVVTAIVVEYRGFDTLGEVTVLFSAATGVSFLLYNVRSRSSRKKTEANFILREGSKLVLPFILLTGVYIFIHGHLTPGGGFPGGSVIASGFLLMMLAYPKFFMNEKAVSVTESLAGITFVSIGLLGMVLATSFLQNFLPLGHVGYLLSAGIIPLIYIAVGFKVGSELSSIVDRMKEVQK